MIEFFVGAAVINFLLLLLASGTDIIYGSAQGLVNIADPYTAQGSFNILMLAANILITLFMTYCISKRVNAQIDMIVYMKRTRNTGAFYVKQKRDLFLFLISGIVGKIVSDVVFIVLFEPIEFKQWIYLLAVFALCGFAWMEWMYFFRVLRAHENICYFIVLVMAIGSLLALMYTGDFSLFGYGVRGYSLIDILFKLISVIVLEMLSFVLIKKVDRF